MTPPHARHAVSPRRLGVTKIPVVRPYFLARTADGDTVRACSINSLRPGESLPADRNSSTWAEFDGRKRSGRAAGAESWVRAGHNWRAAWAIWVDLRGCDGPRLVLLFWSTRRLDASGKIPCPDRKPR